MRLLSADDVRQRLRDEIERETTMSGWASRHGFTEPFVSMVLSGKREPSQRMCQALGVRKQVSYLTA